MPYLPGDIAIDVEAPLHAGGYHTQRHYTLDPICMALKDDLFEGDSIFREIVVCTSLDVRVVTPYFSN